MTKNRWICVLLCAVLALGSVGCSLSRTPAATPEPTAEPTQAPTAEPTQAPTPEPTAEPTPEPTPAAISFEDSYLQYLAVYGALVGEVERRVETHNAVLRSQYPDSYYMNSNYLLQECVPFLPAYPALGSALRDDSVDVALQALRSYYPDAELTMTAPGVYEAVYTYVDKTSGKEVNRSGRCCWECDGPTGALRVRAWVDDNLTEFTEFIPQGDNQWLFYTMADKVLLTYVNGTVTALCHAHRINEEPLGAFAGDVRFCSLDEDDFFPNGKAEREWISKDSNAEYILTLEQDEMVFAGKVEEDVLDQNGNKIGINWLEIEPITLLK